jgi:hypothetical protein
MDALQQQQLTPGTSLRRNSDEAELILEGRKQLLK